MANQKPVDIDKNAIQRAEDTWHNFTKMAKWATVSTLVILALLGVTLIQW